MTFVAHVTVCSKWTVPAEKRHGIHTDDALVSASMLPQQTSMVLRIDELSKS